LGHPLARPSLLRSLHPDARVDKGFKRLIVKFAG